MIEHFIGFYPSPPFWTVDPIDSHRADLEARFTDLMSEVVLDYQHSDFRVQICRDSMVLLQVQRLEAASPFAESANIEAGVTWWSEYLDHVNALYLLLESSILKHLKLDFIRLSEVTLRDAIRVTLENGKPVSYSLPDQGISHLYRWKSALGDHLSLHTRMVVPRPAFDSLIQEFHLVVSDQVLRRGRFKAPVFASLGYSAERWRYSTRTFGRSLPRQRQHQQGPTSTARSTRFQEG